MRRRWSLNRAARAALGEILCRNRESHCRWGIPIEPLEPRRLLASIISGTNGPDSIIVRYNSVTVNGVMQTADDHFTIEGLAGNDSIWIQRQGTAGEVTIHGGLGNDSVVVGQGLYAFSDVVGGVYVEENNGEGNDSITFDDSSVYPYANHSRIHVLENEVYFDANTDFHPAVYFNDNTEIKTINRSDQDDVTSIDVVAPGLTVNLGGGNNTVNYGGPAQIINGDLLPAKINGGVNSDTIVFDDSKGPTAARTYDFTPTAAMNQILSGIENIELDTRVGEPTVYNVISFSGNPTNGLGHITLNGVLAHIEVGAAGAGIDLYNLGLYINDNIVNGEVDIYDQTSDPNQHSFAFDTVGSTPAQRLSKGEFGFTYVPDAQVNVQVWGGSENDFFEVFGVVPNSSILVLGGEGNDTLQSNFDDYELDKIFLGHSFEFSGGDGADLLDLNDSAAAGDGKPDYYVGQDALQKDDVPGFDTSSASNIISYNATTDQVRLFGDADGNEISFDNFSQQSFYIDGGAGGDLFVNDLGPSSIFHTTLVGGAGNDLLDLEDRAGNQTLPQVTEYDLSSTQLSFIAQVPTGDITYDATMESLALDESDGSTTTRLDGKPVNTKLSVSGYGGDDTFIVGGGDFDTGWLDGTTTLIGGDGNDSIEFDDHNDLTAPTTTYTLENQTVTRESDGSILQGAASEGSSSASPQSGAVDGFIFSGFESEQLDAASKFSLLAVRDIININSTAFFTDATIVGPGARPCIVNVTGGNLDNLGGTLTLNMGSGAGDTVNINDQNSTTSTVYTLDDSVLTPGTSAHPINFTGVDQLNLQAGASGDSIYANGVPIGESVMIDGNAGDDYLRLGGGDVAGNLLGPVTFNGDAGNDTFQVFDTAVAANGVVTSSTYTEGPITHTYETCENFWFLGGFALGANVDIESMAIAASLTLGSGDDAIQIGGGNLSNVTGTVNVSAGAGNNSLLLDDRQGPGHNYHVTTSQVSSYKLLITTSGLTSETIQACDNNDIFTVESAVADLTIFANGGNDSITTQSGVTHLDTGSEPAGGYGDQLVVNAGSVVHLIQSDRIAYLHVQSGGTLQVPSGAILDVTNTYAVQNGGVVDIGGAMIVRNGSSQYDAIGAALGIGYANGAWDGTSTTAPVVNSSLAHSSSIKDSLGYALAGNLLNIAGSQTGSWQGQTINPTDVLIKYTYAGDANLDGRINIDDYGRIDGNVGRSGTVFGWYNGDFNFDAKINIDDYGIIDSNIGAQGSPIEQLLER